MEQLPKSYNSNTETEIYSLWFKSGLTDPDKMGEYLKEKEYEVKKPFTITLPPPNANANLHLGHVCGYSFHDVMGRYMRMKGHPVLLLPGKDHAGIQTESVFTKHLEMEGKTKEDLGREKFYEEIYKFCMKNAENAREQEKRIGLSADFSREFFTLDPKLTKIVYETFYSMFEEGLIYRDKRIINQCPSCMTALADIDTEHELKRGIFAYIKYPLVDNPDEYITVATTRPETMLGDTAVAVHPKDKRYSKYVGKKVLLPIADREIPVIADEEVDMELGTGAVKVTPAHSPVDFELGQRHNLEIINVINEKGLMEGDIPERFKGMKTVECSKALVKELDEQGLLERIENTEHEVTVCERCRSNIEPIISNQWYLNVKSLAEEALKELKKGNVKVYPEGQQKALIHFYENIQPWCISRQLWWGQRIPVWYSGGKKLYDWLLENKGRAVQDFEKETETKVNGTGELHLGEDKPESINGEIWEKEEDVFDTWFSSGQWPFTTLGGPDGADFKKYYPTQMMIHARDIVFWWSARMIMMGLYRTGQVPFRDIFVTGMILADDGSKMSKSKGNSVEPKEIFERYGADALRLWYYSDALPGSNAPLREEKIKGNRNFVNKIWNASRFIIMNINESEIPKISKEEIKKTEKIVETEKHIVKVSRYIEKYQFNLGAESIREFFWHQVCDIWIEEIKREIQGQEIGSQIRVERLAELLYILKLNLKIMHPFVPFVTESVWQELVSLNLASSLLMEQQI
ncbi:valine--tRNA ligase [Candidatus Dojkabacteria bacterium]|uniref:Valine--tRNA ligase n=1 Tax=Candidatus Dojkabacteria bacterium TaxID=2099670 RepID=A0A847VDL9_9BACT|nr:valine--tRNA ligase [Candidatus Dojkabacteria bacterium]